MPPRPPGLCLTVALASTCCGLGRTQHLVKTTVMSVHWCLLAQQQTALDLSAASGACSQHTKAGSQFPGGLHSARTLFCPACSTRSSQRRHMHHRQVETPLEVARGLSEDLGCTLLLKREDLQPVGHPPYPPPPPCISCTPCACVQAYTSPACTGLAALQEGVSYMRSLGSTGVLCLGGLVG